MKNNKQPFENFEELPCDIIDENQFDSETEDSDSFISVNVEVFVGKNLNDDFTNAVSTLSKAYVARTTKRSTRFYAGDISYCKDSGLIKFKAGTTLPSFFLENIKYLSNKKIGTTFADFCFLNSTGTKFHTKDQCLTPFRDDHTPGDLTWILPAKFVDDMVEMMSIMNNLILAGTMEEAILYGPEVI